MDAFEEADRLIQLAIRSPLRPVHVLLAPTGGGKTRAFADILKSLLRRPGLKDKRPRPASFLGLAPDVAVKVRKFACRHLALLVQGAVIVCRRSDVIGDTVVDADLHIFRPQRLAGIQRALERALSALWRGAETRELAVLSRLPPPPRRDPEKTFRASRLSNIGISA